MTWQLTPYTVPLALATLIGIAGATIAWRHRSGPVETWSMFAQATSALWALLTVLTVSSVSKGLKLFWLQVFLATIPLLIVFATGFTLHFTGRGEWLTRRRLGVLFAFPAAVLVLTMTNDVHGLVLVDTHIDYGTYRFLDYIDYGSYRVLEYQWGPGAYAYFALSYAIAAVYCGLLFLKVLRSRNVYRRISFVIFVFAAGLVSATVLSAVQKSPFPHFMLLPFANLGLGILLFLGTTSIRFARLIPVDRILSILSSRYGDVVPLARDFIVEAVDNGILVLDENDRVVDINATAKKMIGSNRPVGKHIAEIIQSEAVVQAGELDGILDGSEPVDEVREEVWIRIGDNELCYDVRISAIGSDDEPAGHVVLLHDITEQKRREEQLRARERELELQRDQLEHQNERLDQFASIVSHDLRNPLNVAQGYLETMLTGVDGSADGERETGDAPEEVTVRVEYLEEVARSHDRMENIIEDALALARQGKAITETETVSLTAVAEQAWANVETETATLVVEDECGVVSDRDRLLNVFENLFRNSMEHGMPSDVAADDEHANLTVRVGRLEDAQKSDAGDDSNGEGRNGFYVQDNGCGIPDDEKESVLDEGYTTANDGTGFGLAIVRDIVVAHGWSIAVTDADDGGARFEMTGIELVDTTELEQSSDAAELKRQ
ncbi:histidine kinase N-terminal 7TM domain-containing protein [Natrinema halophilum]|uniref:histidine kinase n=1 Tax=Natrinema halophilum TaxID=1699371 RepID=A0A7D5KWF6_9EURY|nr:histidine kinase N-terminal 7TM domain-containing protein [Natrinema halophilum]QLG47422.1 ATP-binding protein [Natrinema halophilum]